MMIAAFVFDIDNTLYSYDMANEFAFRAVSDYACQTFRLTAEQFTALHQKGDRLLRAHAGGRCAAIHNRLIRYQLMLEQIGQPLFHAPKMAGLYWSALLSHMQPCPGAKQCLALLKSSGYTVGVGTNMTADYQLAKLERLGVLEYVDFMVSSEEVSIEKPDVKFFACCLEKAGRRGDECVCRCVRRQTGWLALRLVLPGTAVI